MTDNKALTKEKIPETEIPPDVLAAIITSALTRYNADDESKIETLVTIEVINEKKPAPKPQEHTLGVSIYIKASEKTGCKRR